MVYIHRQSRQCRGRMGPFKRVLKARRDYGRALVIFLTLVLLRCPVVRANSEHVTVGHG